MEVDVFSPDGDTVDMRMFVVEALTDTLGDNVVDMLNMNFVEALTGTLEDVGGENVVDMLITDFVEA